VDQVAEARLRLVIRGAVQGVGFRPFVYRLARTLRLSGWVCNSPAGVFIEVEGAAEALEAFHERVSHEKPPRASIQSIEHALLDPVGFGGFVIRESELDGCAGALVMSDIATCACCLREISDPGDRRFRYPFTNCTNCGPRYSIIEALPYDRANTTMKHFAMCARCRREYDDPIDRRFHAQPNACPECGPTLELLDPSGRTLCAANEALPAAAEIVRDGRILALKGLGGFHLVADARNDRAVRRLRERKNREEKPFALMAASVEQARQLCEVSALQETLLRSPEAPIVLLKRRGREAAPSVAPGNPYLGVMLPYTPLHHLLMAELRFPIVATSGNLSDEPICTDNTEAIGRLGGIADIFLVHDRPIARRVDDSIVRIVADRAMILRRARGYAPLPITLDRALPPVLAVGAHLKSTTAIAVGRNVFMSQHLGDLETPQAFEAFCESIAGFERLYGFRATTVACDLHPDYRSTRYAETLSRSPVRVQHHYAHVLSCMAENEVQPPVLGVSWDGTGYGLDGTIWGGEFLRVHEGGFERVAHLRTFRLPGGEQAVREPRRSALGVLYELFGENLPMDLGFRARELETLLVMLKKGVNSPVTSSAGRLFDAATAMIGLRQRSSFEGQAAMELEFAVEPCEEWYDGAAVDWESIVRGVLDDRGRGVAPGRIAARFHNSLVEAILGVARNVGEEPIVLTGGCFQNKYLTERAIHRLREDGFRPYWHQRVPPNDGGIALGQVVASTLE
jgi:hydrogenase maturation protein HypF